MELDSVLAHSIEWYETPGQLSRMQIDEGLIPEEDRIPRFTSATWKYENGAIGHLEHGVALQGQVFSTELAVCESVRGGLILLSRKRVEFATLKDSRGWVPDEAD